MHHMMLENGKLVSVEIPDALAARIKERARRLRGPLLFGHVAIAIVIGTGLGTWEPPWGFVEVILIGGYLFGGILAIFSWLLPAIERRYCDHAAMRFRARAMVRTAVTLGVRRKADKH